MGKYKDLTGQTFNFLTVEKALGKNAKGKYEFLCRCKCGKEKVVVGHYLTNNETKSCGHCAKSESRIKEFIGQIFGKLTVVKMVGFTNDRHSIYECNCSCGGTKITTRHRLVAGTCVHCDNCSPKKPKNLIGQTFGKLFVESPVEKDNFARFNCKCECGKSIIVKNHRLLDGSCCSCGCQNLNKQDISGQIFGRLTVLKKFEKNKFGHWHYLCQCSCGKETLVAQSHLRRGNIKSCGCLSKEVASKLGSAKIGSLNPSWRGGIAIANIRKTKEYSSWRRFILKKYDRICIICGDKKQLQAHHLDSVTGHFDKTLDPDNGVCLCKNCHTLFHIEYGFGENNRDQFLEFANSLGINIKLS